MLNLYSPRHGRVEPVRPLRTGQLRTYLAGPAQPGPAQLGELRAAMVADLIGRVAAAHRLRVAAWQGAGVPDAAFLQINVHPAEPAEPIPPAVDVAVAAPGTWRPGTPPALIGWVTPGQVLAGPGATGPPAAASQLLASMNARGLDPLALRLALLRQHYRQPTSLSWAMLEASERALREWRAHVARWAQEPSRPVCAGHVRAVTGAFSDDLDGPAALAALAALAADTAVPPGSKFETFAHLDHLFGLDLARDVGR